jgi:hypothetical protein
MYFYDHLKHVLGEYNSSLHVFLKTIGKHKNATEFQGWALEVGIIDVLEILHCKEVQIKDNNTKFTYITSFENFTKNGSVIPGEYGDKILVAQKYWVIQ